MTIDTILPIDRSVEILRGGGRVGGGGGGGSQKPKFLKESVKPSQTGISRGVGGKGPRWGT